MLPRRLSRSMPRPALRATTTARGVRPAAPPVRAETHGASFQPADRRAASVRSGCVPIQSPSVNAATQPGASVAWRKAGVEANARTVNGARRIQPGALRRLGPRARQIGQISSVGGIERFEDEAAARETLPRLPCVLRRQPLPRENTAPKFAARSAPARPSPRLPSGTGPRRGPIRGRETQSGRPAGSPRTRCWESDSNPALRPLPTEILGGNLGSVEPQRDGAARFASPRDGQALPAGARQSASRKRRGQFSARQSPTPTPGLRPPCSSGPAAKAGKKPAAPSAKSQPARPFGRRSPSQSNASARWP